MKTFFSTKWKGSSQRRKQRKYTANAPLHTRVSFISSALSKELKQKFSKNALPIRTGDTVKVMRGSSKGKTGKVASVDRKNNKITIEGITKTKIDGSSFTIPIHTSNVIITSMVSDKKRIKEIKNNEN